VPGLDADPLSKDAPRALYEDAAHCGEFEFEPSSHPHDFDATFAHQARDDARQRRHNTKAADDDTSLSQVAEAREKSSDCHEDGVVRINRGLKRADQGTNLQGLEMDAHADGA